LVWWADSLGILEPRFTHEDVYLEMEYTNVGGSFTSCCKLSLSSGISSPPCRDCEEGCSHSEDPDAFMRIHLGITELKKLKEMCEAGINKLENDKVHLD
jgi:hypothetical protein